MLLSKKRDRENEGDKPFLLYSSRGFLGIYINEERCEETQLQVLTYRLPERLRGVRCISTGKTGCTSLSL